jgi:hypothetical protein
MRIPTHSGTAFRLSFVAIAAAAVAMPALAVQSDDERSVIVDQHPGVTAQDSIAVDQISSARSAAAGDEPQLTPRGAPGQLPEQSIEAPAKASGGVAQLSDRDASHQAPTQLYRGGRTAAPATPLSTPDQGKPEAVARLKGHDRCDPGQPDHPSEDCKHAIETRSEEFAHQAPTELTPEQKLLIGEQRDFINDPQATVKRIGRNDVEADDPSQQSVASIVLAPPPDKPPAKTPDPTTGQPDLSQAAQAIVDAITQANPH